MKIYKMLLAGLLAALLIGCFASPEENTQRTKNTDINAQPSPAENAPSNEPAETGDETIKMEEVYPVKEYSQKTPTETMKTYIMATVNKDVPTVKSLLSKGSLKMIEESAKEQDKTVGEILTRGAVDNKSKKIPQFRNEKVDGDQATVEYKDETMPEFLTMPLVKEDGKWKIALDVFRENLMRDLTEEMNEPARKNPK
ncbi:MAG: hypothetical protein R2747_13890 [Pyrinomonadaceae bacterium]